MDRLTRVLLIVLVIAYIPGTPGLGLETRDSASAPAAWLALASGALAVLLPGIDLTGALAGPPPPGMRVLDLILVVLGLAITVLVAKEDVLRTAPPR